MKRLVVSGLFSSAIAASGAVHADWSFGGGAEYFRWKESTSPQVKETGMRWALDLAWAQSRAPGLSFGYNLHLYSGNVDYEGALLFTGTPITGETTYRGLTNEFQVYYRTPHRADFVFAAAWDRWDRRLSRSQEESFDVIYLKAGVGVNAATRRGAIATAGVKYPIWVREDANFTTLGGLTDPRLRPEGDWSLYGTIGYRFNPSWDVVAYYDSYRFNASPTVTVPLSTGGSGTFFQPESRMDVFGVRALYNF